MIHRFTVLVCGQPRGPAADRIAYMPPTGTASFDAFMGVDGGDAGQSVGRLAGEPAARPAGRAVCVHCRGVPAVVRDGPMGGPRFCGASFSTWFFYGRYEGRPASSLLRQSCDAAFVTAFIKLRPFGVPSPVTLSQPSAVFSDVSVPNVSTNQRVENGLLYIAL